MKSLPLMIALALPQVASAQSDPFMDLTMPDMNIPALKGDPEQLGKATPNKEDEATADPLKDLPMPDKPDNHLTVSPYGCPPQRIPSWKQELPIKEVYKATLLLTIYEATWIRNVERYGSCDCETRVPPWDEADLIYQTVFANLEAGDQVNLRQKIGEANRLRLREVDKLCNEEMP